MRAGIDLSGCFPTGRHYPGIAHLLRIQATGLAEEFPSEHPVAELKIVSIDTETTGRDPNQDRIVEISCVSWDGAAIVRRKSWLLNPNRPIPKEASDIHGISDQDVADKPEFFEIADQLLAEMGGAVPLAYNAEYDRKVLSAELGRLPNGTPQHPPAARRSVDWIDPLVWARELHREEKGKSLSEVCQRLGIESERAHRAEEDATAALQVFLAFAGDARVPKTYGALMQEQRRLFRLFDDEHRVWRNRTHGATQAPARSSSAPPKIGTQPVSSPSPVQVSFRDAED